MSVSLINTHTHTKWIKQRVRKQILLMCNTPSHSLAYFFHPMSFTIGEEVFKIDWINTFFSLSPISFSSLVPSMWIELEKLLNKRAMNNDQFNLQNTRIGILYYRKKNFFRFFSHLRCGRELKVDFRESLRWSLIENI